jgi:diacylglycerol O-acyltransferase / wax synthase
MAAAIPEPGAASPAPPPRSARSPVQLSATDASFLMQERGSAHMHIGGVSVFEGPAPDHEQLKAHLDERLGLVPRFRQRLVPSPLGLRRPWWVADPQFNLDYHLRRSALPHPGSERQLEALVARVFAQRLDRGKPLWEMYLVEGLEDGRFALITKAHHALVDGISGVDLASVILDTAPQPAPMGGAVTPFLRRPAPSRAELIAREASDAARIPLTLTERAIGAIFYPRRITRGLETLGAAVGSASWELMNPAPDLPLNGAAGPHRLFAARHLSLDMVRSIRRRHNVTVNDVVVAAATAALREWLIARGVSTDGLELRALVPVNLRTDDERGLLGNRVALLRAPLPVYIADDEERLQAVHETMAQLKRSRQLMAAQAIIELSDFAPPTILAQASRLNFSTRLFNLIITNVPGPQLPLYLLGHRLETVAPIAFLPSGHALAIAVFSYNGTLSFGLLGDYDRMRDLDTVADAVLDALERLAPETQPIGATSGAGGGGDGAAS